MFNINLLTLWTFVHLFSSNFCFSQNNEIRIRFIGNCGLHMTDGQTSVYFDFPYKSGAYGYMTYNQKELDSIVENSIFIFTHKHKDHYSAKNMNAIIRNKNGRRFTQWQTKKLKSFSETIPEFDIEILKTKHRFSIRHISYVITWHGKKIYLSGDTENAEAISVVKDIDWAFVPYWILLDASEKGLKIDAKQIGVYHLYPNQKIQNSSPEKIILLDKQGMILTIPY